MLFTDLLRLTVLLVGGLATALGGVAIVAADAADDTLTLIVTGGWWAIAVVLGLVLGRADRAHESVAEVLASARTITSLPDTSANRIALGRLWPLGVFALVAGGLAAVFPSVPAIGSGYALLVALMWRNREAAVTGVEDRDGVRFTSSPPRRSSPCAWSAPPASRATARRSATRRPRRPPDPPGQDGSRITVMIASSTRKSPSSWKQRIRKVWLPAGTSSIVVETEMSPAVSKSVCSASTWPTSARMLDGELTFGSIEM
jgi:hypothetical protein